MASGAELKPPSTLGITWGRAEDGKTKPPPTSRDGEGAFWAKWRIKQNKHLPKELPGRMEMRTAGKAAQAAAGSGRGEGGGRQGQGVVLDGVSWCWKRSVCTGLGCPRPAHRGIPSLPSLPPLPPCRGCWPCLAQRGLCPAAGKESSVCSQLLSAALFALGEEQLRFTGPFCKYCAL